MLPMWWKDRDKIISGLNLGEPIIPGLNGSLPRPNDVTAYFWWRNEHCLRNA